MARRPWCARCATPSPRGGSRTPSCSPGCAGSGKTTTARLLARAFNYETDTDRCPTVDFREEGRHCRAIIEGKHIDVLELDAATQTGVDNMRSLLESVRYGPIEGRYKVYIIDEVHMLSGSAFASLLKTLEEPPPHAKFIFATTEIRKVPVTILSRTQRLRPAPRRARRAGQEPGDDLRERGRAGRGRGADADRAGRRGVGARRPVDAGPGDRARPTLG
jgi:DNA polymerase III delta prime subunit